MDMLLLGGLSMLVWLVFRFVELDEKEILFLAFGMMFLANFVNHPHFMHSYQMFFEIWPVIKKEEKANNYKTRWLVAALLIPTLLVIFLSTSVYFSIKGDLWPMQMCLGLYAILVGWHYVKQSFGMALWDAARSKVYWTAKSRKTLFWNSYINWAAALIIGAGALAGGDFWGVRFPTFSLLSEFTAFAAVVAAASATWTLLIIWRQIQSWKASGIAFSEMPFAGIVGYIVGIYLWTLLAWLDHKFILMIPFFHSLQYLLVVSKYRKGKNRVKLGTPRLLPMDALWYAKAVVLGAAAFWVIPGGLEYLQGGKLNYLSGGVFIFTAAIWIFINVHHYFIDNVIWKKENPLMNKYMFD